MLAELAAANAAFSIIKETINNGGDILAAGQHLFSYFDNKAAIQKKAKDGGMKSDLEEFMALEKLKQQEQELRQLMIYQGRGGLWDDWMQFQVEARKKREKAEAEARLKRQKRIEALKTTGMIILLVAMLGGLGVIIGAIIYYGRHNL
jgi:DNA polymerase III gamma/tau subunit